MAAKNDIPHSELDDIDGVAEEHASLQSRVRPPPKGPVLVLGSLAMVALAVTGLVVRLLLFQPFDARDLPGAQVMAEHVPSHVIAVSHGDQQGAALARQAATGPRARSALGNESADALQSMLEATEALAATPLEQRGPAHERFVAAAATLNVALEKQSHPFFVDADTALGQNGLLPVLLTFYIEREVRAASGENKIRCVHLRRLDDLNIRQGYLGYTRATTPAAIVLLDQIETELIHLVLPALPDGEQMDLVDAETEIANEPWVGAVRSAGAAAVRAHYASMPKEHTEGVDRVGTLVARRRALVKKWRGRIADFGKLLLPPDRLIPTEAYTSRISHMVRGSDLREWDDIHDELLSKSTLTAFQRLRDRYADSVQRHEVQHRLDYQRGLMPYPEVLQKLLPTDTPLGLEAGTLHARARDELSAYLAEMSRSPDSPMLTFVLLASHLFNKAALGGAYSYAALAALDAISSELGIDFWEHVRTRIERKDVAKVFLKVVERPPEEVRSAAQRAYEKAYEQRVPDVAIEGIKQNEPWLH